MYSECVDARTTSLPCTDLSDFALAISQHSAAWTTPHIRLVSPFVLECRPVVWLALASLLVGCEESNSHQTDDIATGPQAQPVLKESSPTAPTPNGVAVAAWMPGNSAQGRELVQHFQCARCHDGLDVPPFDLEENCVHCHQAIGAGTLGVSRRLLDEWRSHLHSLPYAPSLAAAGQRWKPRWLANFLLEPHDLRPALGATMPRLAMTQAQAHDIATYITRDRGELSQGSTGDAARGRELAERLGCGSCHRFGELPVQGAAPTTAEGIALAPDLAVVRERFRPDRLAQWIRDPQSILPTSSMPKIAMSESDANDIAAFLLEAEIPAAPEAAVPQRLPILGRRVTYEEVAERVFRRICWHCHSNNTFALGDGGPGNAGGFGFEPRGVDLATYEGVRGGAFDENHQRTSLFRPTELDGETMPRLVAVLRARQLEVAGRANEIRGMPLGFEPVTPEELQLVESWIFQGRPR